MAKKGWVHRIDPYSNKLPIVVEESITFLRDRGMQSEGIFRKSGSQMKIRDIKAKYLRNEKVNTMLCSVDDIAGVLKLFFRELREPLCTYERYDMFIAAVETGSDINEKLKRVKLVIDDLPPGNKIVLKYLCKFLVDLAANFASTKMTSANLSIVFAPNLIAPQSGLGNTIGVMFTNTPQSNALLDMCISHYDLLLADLPNPGDEIIAMRKSKKEKIRISEGGTKHELPTIEITLWKGRNLKKGDRLTRSSDPYVKIYVGDTDARKSRFKSEILNKTTEPVWNHAWRYTFVKPPLKIKFKVMDYDWNSKDDFLGITKVYDLIEDFNLMNEGDTYKQWLPLSTQGDLQISIRVVKKLLFN